MNKIFFVLFFLNITNAFSYDVDEKNNLDKQSDKLLTKTQYLQLIEESTDEKEIFSLMQNYFSSEDNPDSIILIIDKYTYKIKNLSLIKKLLIQKADMENLIGNIEKAQLYYFEAANLYKEIDFALFFQSAVLNLKMGNYNDAEEQFIKIVKNTNDIDLLFKSKVMLLWILEKTDRKYLNNSIEELNNFDFSKIDNTSIYEFYKFLKYSDYSDDKKITDLINKIKPESMEMLILKNKIEIYPDTIYWIDKKQELTKNSQISSEISDKYLIQTGLFENEENANILLEKLNEYGFNVSIKSKIKNEKTYYSVIVIVENKDEIQNTMIKLKDKNIEGFIIK